MADFFAEAVSAGCSLSKRCPVDSSQRMCNIRRAKSAVQDGQYRKAIKALTSGGLASPCKEVLREMLSKHPQGTVPHLPPGLVPPSAILHESAIRKGVMSFPNGSAPGPSGLRPSHLKEAVQCQSPDHANRLLTSLTNFVNLLAAGRAPPSFSEHLCGATLLPLRKKNGCLRPIAVGEVL